MSGSLCTMSLRRVMLVPSVYTRSNRAYNSGMQPTAFGCGHLIGRSQARRVPDRSFGPAHPRSRCAVARSQRRPWTDSSKASVTALHASSSNRISANGGAGRPASTDDDLRSGSLRGYTSQTVLSSILENQRDGRREALQGSRFRAALPIRPGDLRTVSDIPALVAFHYRHELVSHTLLWLSGAPSLWLTPR